MVILHRLGHSENRNAPSHGNLVFDSIEVGLNSLIKRILMEESAIGMVRLVNKKVVFVPQLLLERAIDEVESVVLSLVIEALVLLHHADHVLVTGHVRVGPETQGQQGHTQHHTEFGHEDDEGAVTMTRQNLLMHSVDTFLQFHRSNILLVIR